MGYTVGRNTRVEIQKTLGAPKTITAISKANPGVATSTTHGFANGAVLLLADALTGMTELAGQVVRAAAVAADTFQLESIDTTGFGTFTAGTASEVTVFSTLSNAVDLQSGSAAKDWLESTVLLDTEKQYLPGMDDVPEITLNLRSDPLLEAMTLVEAAARAGTALIFRVTLNDGSVRLFRGYPTLPTESIQQGQISAASFTVRQIRRRLAFAS